MATAPYTLEQAEEAIADLRAQVDRMGEVHALDGSGGVVPNAQPNQAQLYTASDGQPSYVTPSGLSMGSMGAQQAWFPGNTVTSVALGNLAAQTIPANDAAVGAVYEIEAWGNGTQGTIGNRQTLQFSVMLGGTSLSTVQFGTTSFPDTNVIFRWRAVARAICNTTGAAGTWTSYILATENVFNVNFAIGNANFAHAFSCEASGTQVKDTTTGQSLGLSAGWGATTGGPTLTSQVAIFKRLC